MKFLVGHVERIVCEKVQQVCACCALSVKHCTCQHEQTMFDTDCPNRRSTFQPV